MGRRNSVPEIRDLQSLNFVTWTLCIFGGRWRTRFQNNAWGGGLCLWGGRLNGRWGTLYLTKKPGSQMETTSVCITSIFAFLKLCFIWKYYFVCLISWCLVTILSFGTYTVHCNFKTDNLLSTCKVLSPILSVKSDCISTNLMCLTTTISMLYWCSTGGPDKHPVKSDTIWRQNVFHHGSWNYISQPSICTDNKDCLGIKICIPKFWFVQCPEC